MECGHSPTLHHQEWKGWKERLSTWCPGRAQIRSLLKKAPAQSILSLRGEQGEMSPWKDTWLQPKGKDLAHKGLLWAGSQLMVHGKWSMGVTKDFWDGTATSECIHLPASFLLCSNWKDKTDFKGRHISHHYIYPQALQWLCRLSGSEEIFFTLILSLKTFSKQVREPIQMYAPQTCSVNGSCSI